MAVNAFIQVVSQGSGTRDLGRVTGKEGRKGFLKELDLEASWAHQKHRKVHHLFPFIVRESRLRREGNRKLRLTLLINREKALSVEFRFATNVLNASMFDCQNPGGCRERGEEWPVLTTSLTTVAIAVRTSLGNYRRLEEERGSRK